MGHYREVNVIHTTQMAQEITQESQSETFKNVMEALVVEEVTKQTEKLPPSVTRYLNLVDVATYALNRLPSLYASSQEGEKWQRWRAKEYLETRIRTTVQKAIASVEKDPIRLSTPLEKEATDNEIIAAFEDLRNFLKDFVRVEKLSNKEVVSVMKQTIARAAETHKLGRQTNLGRSYSRKQRTNTNNRTTQI